MTKLLLASILLSIPALWAAEPIAEPQAQTTLLGERLRLNAGIYYSTGEASWTERGQNGRAFIDRYRSKLEYNDIDSLMLIFGGEITLSDQFRIAGRFGFGDIDDANGSDSDANQSRFLERARNHNKRYERMSDRRGAGASIGIQYTGDSRCQCNRRLFRMF